MRRTGAKCTHVECEANGWGRERCSSDSKGRLTAPAGRGNIVGVVPGGPGRCLLALPLGVTEGNSLVLLARALARLASLAADPG